MNRVACVTGADRGLGLAIVHWLLEKQFSVFAGQYLEDSILLKALNNVYPEQLQVIALDIGSKDSVQQAERAIASRTGHIDIIINNAGIVMLFHPGWMQTYMHGEINMEAPITPK